MRSLQTWGLLAMDRPPPRATQCTPGAFSLPKQSRACCLRKTHAQYTHICTMQNSPEEMENLKANSGTMILLFRIPQ